MTETLDYGRPTRLELQRDVLELIATGAPLDEVLSSLCRLIDGRIDGGRAMVMLVDDDGEHLSVATGPNAPRELLALGTGIEIADGNCSCGTAVARGEPVFVEDIRESELFDEFADEMVPLGVVASWSYPIGSRERRPLGTFAITLPTAGLPDDAAVELLSTASRLAEIALERHAAVEALVRERSFVTTVLDSVDSPVLALDRDGAIVRWNDACRRLAGCDHRDVGSRLEALVIPAHRARIAARLRDALAGSRCQFEAAWHVRSGEERTVVWTYVPAFDDQGTVRYVIGTGADVTDRRAARQVKELLETELRQAQKMEAVGVLASGVAHDFNNLLTAIYGYTELAKDTLPSGHPAVRSLDLVEESARAAEGVSKSLLAFSHRADFERAPLDLAETVRGATKLLRRLIPAAVEFVEVVEGDVEVWVQGDPTQVQQVLMNLVINARDAMPGGGLLEVTVRRDDPDGDLAARHELDAPLGVAVLEVRDTGIGMTAETQARIFEPLFTTKPREFGTGLGLSVLRGIVVDHDGAVEVESELGSGSIFRVVLPLCARPEAVRHEERRDATVAGGGRHVVVVEDDGYVRSILASALRATGFRVSEAGDGDEAVELFERVRDDACLMVLDLDLPSRSGIEVLGEVRRLEPEFPILMMTGDAGLEVAHHEEAFENLLRKPFRMADLVDEIDALLDAGAVRRDP